MARTEGVHMDGHRSTEQCAATVSDDTTSSVSAASTGTKSQWSVIKVTSP